MCNGCRTRNGRRLISGRRFAGKRYKVCSALRSVRVTNGKAKAAACAHGRQASPKPHAKVKAIKAVA